MQHDDAVADTTFRASDAPPVRASGLYRRHVKRALDVVFVLLVAPFAAPLVALLAVLVARDGAPPIFGQTRIGRDGRRYTCWKLRSMVPDAEAKLAELLSTDEAAAEEWRVHQKLCRDPRVTPLGAWLRRTSLDELPQLWNVLAGEMSLVGPRPMTPDQQSIYPGAAYYALRPGITGPWQITERHDSAFAARAVHDTRYAQEVSLGLDLSILLRTAGVVIKGGGR